MKNLKLIAILMLLGLPGVVCAQTSKSGRTTRGTLALRPACPSVASAGDIYEATDQNPLLTTVCDPNNGWISLGGGANPNGNNGDVQTKNGSSLAAGHINDNGSTLISSEDSQFTTNPYQDIRNYNIRAAKSSATTVTCTSGLATVTLGAAQTFINNVGVVARGCGAANGLSTPSAPTVTAAQLAGPPGSGLFVANSTGSTSYSYSVVATTELRGYTPASAVTTITNGPASLGVQSFTMSGWTASNSTVTVTTTASHGLVAGAMVWVQDFLLGNSAPYIVQTVPSNTTFTITVAQDTRNGFPTSGGSSGTGFYYNAIHVSVPTNVSSVFQYFVYGGSAGSGNLLRPMLPQSNTAALSGDLLNNTLDDLGSSMMALPTLPDWVPATAPGAAKANDLVTTIVSGGGTTSLTLAATAGSNQSGVTFKEDDGPNLKTALTASQSNNIIIQVPAGVGVVTNSIVDVVSVGGWQIQQAGSVTLNDTLIATMGYWTGGPIIGAASGPNFPFQGLPTITANGFPSVWFGPNTNSRSNWNNINFAGSTNGVIFLLDMGSIPQFGFSNSSMATTGTNDCISNHFVSRTTPAGGAFERITNFSDSVGTCTVNSQAPAIILEDTRGNGPWSIQNLFLNRRGLYSGGVFIGKIDSVYMQGALTPKLLFSNVGGVANGGPWIKISNSVEDTTFSPTVAYFGGGMAGHIYVEGSNGPGGGVPAITGSGGIFVHCLSNNTGAPVSTNNTCGAGVDSVIQYQSSVILDGLRNTGPTGQAVEYDNFNTILGPLYGLSATTIPMPAPVVSATSGGTVPTGNHSEQVAPVFPTGNGKFSEGPLSAPSNTVNVLSGTQTLTFSITPVAGAVGYDLYDNGFSVQCSAPYASGAPTTITWNGTPSRCGQSAPNGPGGGPTSITANALTSPQVTTSGNGFTSSATAPNLSANRNETIPDVTGTRAEVTGSTTSGHCAQMGAVTGQITDSGGSCGGAPASPSLSVQYNNSGAFGGIPNGLTGQYFQSTNGVAPAFTSPGLADGNGGSGVTTTPYLIQCDSGTALVDRIRVLRLQSGASVVNIPSSTASGCTGNFAVTLMDDGAGTVTVQRNAGSTDTFSIFNNVVNSDSQTSFQMVNGQSLTLNQGATGIWEVRGSAPPSGNNSLFATAANDLPGAVVGLPACSDGAGNITTTNCNQATFGRAIFATAYGVKADGNFVTDASFTNGSGAVATTSNDPQFLSTDVGKLCWGTTYQGGTGSYNANTLKMGTTSAVGTISVFTDAHHVTCSVNWTGTTGPGTFVWGHDDTSALAAAWNAAANPGTSLCSVLFLPAGIALTTTGQFDTATCVQNIPSTGDATLGVIGQSFRNTGIGIIPTFNFSHSTSCNGKNLAGACFFGISGMNVENLTIYGFGWDNTAAPASTYIADLGIDSYYFNVDIQQFGASDTNLVAYNAPSGAGSYAYNINSNGGGGIGLQVSGIQQTYASYWCCSVTSLVQINSGGFWTDSFSGVQGGGCGNPQINVAGDAIMYRTGLAYTCTSGNGIGLKVTSTGTATWRDVPGVGMPSGGTANAISLDGVLYLGNVYITVTGSQRAFGSNTGSKFFDQCGNTLTGGAGNFANGAVFGSCSVTGVTQTSGNWSTPAGSSAGQWGTTPSVGSCSGNSLVQQCTITVGSGTVGSNPVVTITFPTTSVGFLQAPMCDARMVGGTATFSNFANGTVTGASAAFTYNGTPAASSTIILKVSCGL